MNSIVCIKRVPDSEARIRVAADGRSIDPSGVKFDMNEFDKYALEDAIQRREVAGEGLITVITVGGTDARETLRQALAMGADAVALADTGRASAAAVVEANLRKSRLFTYSDLTVL